MNSEEWNRLVRNLSPFIGAWVALSVLLIFPKGTVILEVNHLHTSFGDEFFRRISALGNAYTALVLLILVLRFPYKYLVIYLLGFLVHVLFVHVFKQWISAGALRPWAFFYRSGDAALLELVEGVKIRNLDSFPSGHTATALYLASFFAVMFDRTWLRWAALLMGITVGLSRIYLVQHWFVDTYFGMIFGIASTLIGWYVVSRNPRAWHAKRLHLKRTQVP